MRFPDACASDRTSINARRASAACPLHWRAYAWASAVKVRKARLSWPSSFEGSLGLPQDGFHPIEHDGCHGSQGGNPALEIPGLPVRFNPPQGGLGGPKPGFHAAGAAGHHQRRRIRHPQRRPRLHRRRGQRFEPVKHGRHGAAEVQGHPLAIDQAPREIQVPRGRGMPEGFYFQAVVLVPSAGPQVQLRRAFLPAPSQPLPQEIREKTVIAVPSPFRIQGNEEEVGALEMLEGFLARSRGNGGNGVAERAAEPVQDGRAEQEPHQVFGLTAKDLLHEEVRHERVAPGEGLDELAGLLPSPEGDRGKLQARGPALCAGFQRGHVVRWKVQTHGLVEELGRLGSREAKIRGAQLGQLAPDAQPGEGQIRILARDDGHVHLRRLVLEQESDGVGHGPGLDAVIVVKDEEAGGRELGDVVEQRREERFGRLRAGG